MIHSNVLFAYSYFGDFDFGLSEVDGLVLLLITNYRKCWMNEK